MSVRTLVLPLEDEVLERLRAWGDGHLAVRALVLTSSRAKPDGGRDVLSDYDVIIATREAAAFAADEGWASAYGLPLVRWGDEDSLHGMTTYFRGVIYADGVKIDYTIWPDVLLDRVSEAGALPHALDVGYRVLLDKEGRTARWPRPTYRAHIPSKPTKSEYEALVDEFWWDTSYVGKSLWRGEVFFAKFMLDYDTKFVALRRLLEWRVEIDHGWSLKPGSHGRGLEGVLPADTWSELAQTYVGTSIEDNWDALLRTIAVFRRVAIEVGDALGYAYPQDADDAMTGHLAAVRSLPRND
jgi:aminoglycoside 6-adenylyltransferase